ncbi:hypothetical protein BC940DRAFT_292700 [Gongronella butleri]|nr:hypothetical protein BC940DRAFT_292700 [Gongronella butleri]
MSMAAPLPQPHRISRKLTVSVDAKPINVRPVVKGALQEAANTLQDAYGDQDVLSWCCRGGQNESNDMYFKFFKNILNAASLASRDYVVQAEGCKGVMVFSGSKSGGFGRPSVTKLAKMLGWMASVRAVMYQSWRDKVRKRVMADHDSYLTLEYLGVLRCERRNGIATALLNHLIEKADKSHMPIFAEVMVEHQHTLEFLKHHGFEPRIVLGLCNNDELPVAFMVREPNTSNPAIPLRLKPGRRESDNTL